MKPQNQLILVFFLLWGMSVCPQNMTTYSTENNDSDFIDAIKVYEKVVEDGRLEDKELLIKIASAYYFNSDYENAIKWFEKYYKIKDVTPYPIYNYWYGQSLKVQKRYKEADALLAPYYESKGERYDYVSSTMETIDLNSDRYELIPFEHNTTYSDYPAYFHKDRLYYITSIKNKDNKRSGLVNKYTSDVFFIDDPKKPIQSPKGELNSIYNEGSLVITRDGRTMYFTRNSFLNNRYAKKSKKDKERIITLNIYKAELIDGKWQNITPLSINNLEYSVAHPALSLDEKTLYFSSNMPGGKGETDLYSVEIKDNGKLGKPVNLEALNTIAKEMFPFIDIQNGNLHFSSNRSSSLGGFDVYISPLETNGEYRNTFNIGEPINSSFDDFAYMTNSSKKGYFASNRDGEELKDEVYAFVESKPFTFPIFLAMNGTAKDPETGKPIAGAEISLYDKEGNVIETVISDANGKYKFTERHIAELSYIKIEKEGYLTSEISLNPEKLTNKNAKLDLTPIAVALNRSETISLSGRIKDKNATDVNEGMSGATITLYDINENVIATTKTDENGNYNFDGVNRKDVAFIRIEKEGYLTEELGVNGNIIKGEELDISTALATRKVSTKQGSDIASILNTIYFDTGKSAIREDAKIELEKIVQVLNQYNDLKIQVGSHTDSRSSSAFNLKLSQRRAKSTYNYLVSRGISSARLSYKGYGESELINRCTNGVKCSEEEHQLNRRSTFTIRN